MYFSMHNHSHYSNLRLKDSTNKIPEMLDYMVECGIKGCALTDHETVAGFMDALNYMKGNDKFDDFKFAIGNEIYLLNSGAEYYADKLNNRPISFYHFILISKNMNGWMALKELSSIAWNNKDMYRGLERVPTFKNDLKKILKKYPNSLIGSSACLGGEIPKKILTGDIKGTKELIREFKEIFNGDFYLELQPSHNEEQVIVNQTLLKLSYETGVKCVVTTDSHYLNKSKRASHKAYLQSKEGEREVDDFYATTYIMSYDELLEYFKKDVLDTLCENTLEVMDKIEAYDPSIPQQLSPTHIPIFNPNTLLDPYLDDYPYIKKYRYSKDENDRYYLKLICDGMQELKQELNEENIGRINLELGELWEISQIRGQSMAKYHLNVKENVDLMWEVSLVGISRGSCCCYYVNYLLKIVQINPLKYNLPHWRYLSKERPTLPDADIDSEGAKRKQIVELVKQHYGEDRVVNGCTFTTEGSASAVLTACRGLGIDNDIANNIRGLIPRDGGAEWDLHDVLYGNEEKERKPCKEFKDAITEFEGLEESMMDIYGLISARSQHASALYIYPEPYINYTASMSTSDGLVVTQFKAEDVEQMGGLKQDFLTINALDRIRSAMDMMLKYGVIEWQGSLRATYDKYLHPDVLDMTNPKMFEMLYNGDVFSCFQFTSAVGSNAIRKLKARAFKELVIANSLMRLKCEGEQPLDRFIRFRNNPQEWFDEMTEYGLTPEEQQVLKEHLMENYGVCDTQEELMRLVMDENIGGFTLTEANNFRKAIAKKSEKKQKEQKKLLFEKGVSLGVRKEFLNYIWDYQIRFSLSYAFSLPHTIAYTLIGVQEMNICLKYGTLWWKTGCLMVDSGMYGEDYKTPKYGDVARAITSMIDDVLPPDINKSEMEFVPVPKENKIYYGLLPIIGISESDIEIIKQCRPYGSFYDFCKRVVDEGLLTTKKVMVLIKAGCFDCFCKDRRKVAEGFIRHIVKLPEKITMTQIKPILNQLREKEEFKDIVDLYEFKSIAIGKRAKMNNNIEATFLSKYANFVDYDYVNDKLVINDKSFEKYYKKEIKPLQEYLKNNEEPRQMLRTVKMRELWMEHCTGNVSNWEMQVLDFYFGVHELNTTPIEKYLKIDNFEELDEEPTPIRYNKWKGHEFPVYDTSTIVGTVIDKNKVKSLIYVLTQHGVVTVKVPKGQYVYYDRRIVDVKMVNGKQKKTVIENSWFTKGTILAISGYRRGTMFMCKKGKNQKHSIMKINRYNKNNIEFLQERLG